jgi:A/G-specific adenine glycosylase
MNGLDLLGWGRMMLPPSPGRVKLRAVPEFAQTIIAWQRRHGRRGLPWQGTRDPYRIWLSEVMLQQTQVETVIPYYGRFLEQYPDVRALAAAAEEDVLRLWSGLGYYARARNLHRAARIVSAELGGRFPDAVQGLVRLPGIGRSSAAAIAAFAFRRREAILDGNVKRVFARCFGIEGYPGARAVEQRLWQIAVRELPQRDIGRYTQALMDLGATVCVRGAPRCDACPLAPRCVARRDGRTATLPAPRPRKPYPERIVTWLVLMHAGRVLLERRPAPGLWGGLWALPESEPRGFAAFCRREFGCEARKARRLAPLEHQFTHFRLRATPVVIALRAAPAAAAEAPGRMWLDLADASGAAVPAPVKRLLARLATDG